MPSIWGFFFYHKTKLAKTKEKELIFAFGNQQGRMSVTSTALHIWVNVSFKTARLRLVDWKTQLLPRLCIVRKLDVRVFFGRNRFHVGQGEWEMMTFNEKHRCVFPLAPTACDYAKLDEYFREMQNEQIVALQVQGNFGDHSDVRKVTKSKSQRSQGEMEI